MPEVELKTKGRHKVRYWEAETGHRERWVRDGVEAVRMLRVGWDDRLKLVQDLIGYSQRVGGALKRELPEVHPQFGWLYCTACEFRQQVGIGVQEADGRFRVARRDADGNITDKDGYAVYECFYKPLPYSVRADNEVTKEYQRFTEKEVRFGTDSLTLPGQILQWGVAPKDKIPEPSARAFGTLTLQYTWREIPTLNTGYFLSKLSTVNDAVFDPEFINAQPGTLLFQTCEARRVYSAIAYGAWDITFSFLYRARGHNSLFRRTRGATDYYDFDPVESVKSGQPAIYDTSDFDKLFQLDAVP